MLRKSILIFLVALVGMAAGCAKTEDVPDPAEAAWDTLVSVWNEAETPEAKVTLAEEYLAQFPDTEHSGSLAGIVAYYRGHEMDDSEGAWNTISAALAQIEDPEQRFEVSMEGLGLADSVDVPLDITVVAEELGAFRPLTFDEHQRVAEMAIELEEWTLADEHALGALEMATPEQVREDYPDREFTDEQVATRVQRRRASMLAASSKTVRAC